MDKSAKSFFELEDFTPVQFVGCAFVFVERMLTIDVPFVHICLGVCVCEWYVPVGHLIVQETFLVQDVEA